MLLFVLVIVAGVFWLVFYFVWQDSRTRETLDRALRQKQNALLDDYLRRLEDAVEQHHVVLLRKRGQLLYRDEYAHLVTDAWDREKKFFLLKRVDHPDPSIVLRDLDGWYSILDGLLDDKALEIDSDSTMPTSERVTSQPPLTGQYLPPLAAPATTSSLSVPVQYERHCAELAAEAGWAAALTPLVGDQGADIVLERQGLRCVVQCKYTPKPVGNAAVQQVVAARAFYHARLAVVVAPSGFTAAARQLASSTQVHLLHHDEIVGALTAMPQPPDSSS